MGRGGTDARRRPSPASWPRGLPAPVLVPGRSAAGLARDTMHGSRGRDRANLAAIRGRSSEPANGRARPGDVVLVAAAKMVPPEPIGWVVEAEPRRRTQLREGTRAHSRRGSGRPLALHRQPAIEHRAQGGRGRRCRADTCLRAGDATARSQGRGAWAGAGCPDRGGLHGRAIGGVAGCRPRPRGPGRRTRGAAAGRPHDAASDAREGRRRPTVVPQRSAISGSGYAESTRRWWNCPWGCRRITRSRSRKALRWCASARPCSESGRAGTDPVGRTPRNGRSGSRRVEEDDAVPRPGRGRRDSSTTCPRPSLRRCGRMRPQAVREVPA